MFQLTKNGVIIRLHTFRSTFRPTNRVFNTYALEFKTLTLSRTKKKQLNHFFICSVLVYFICILTQNPYEYTTKPKARMIKKGYKFVRRLHLHIYVPKYTEWFDYNQ